MFKEGDIMSFNQEKYIKEYNNNNYKMYQFRVKKKDKKIIKFLDSLENKNSYINDLIINDAFSNIYSIKEIKNIIKPILKKYDINEVYLFGSYARGEANKNSDIDIYCEKGNIKTFIDQENLIEELEEALKKKVDIIYTTTKVNDYFKSNIMEDMIKLC